MVDALPIRLDNLLVHWWYTRIGIFIEYCEVNGRAWRVLSSVDASIKDQPLALLRNCVNEKLRVN